MLVAIWASTQQYLGLDGDAKLYAFQALARIQPALVHDLFLQNVSQDRFTIFSPFYAWVIQRVGLPFAAVTLTAIFKVSFLASSWWVARALTNRMWAFWAVAVLIIAPADYGAFHVFQYSENWLTARSPAEALVVVSLALHFRNFKNLALLASIIAFFIHPLMALPGMALLTCLRAPAKIALLGAALAILMSLAVALVAVQVSPADGLFQTVDGDWLEIAQERSKFLFLQLWSWKDWLLNARPFLTLIIAALCSADLRVRQLCFGAMVVGLTGLAVAVIASLIGPVALLIQGQAWRSLWIPGFASAVLLAPTLRTLWRDYRCGPICGVLLACGWIFAPNAAVPCLTLAIIIWSMRTRLTKRLAESLRWCAVAVVALIAAWTIKYYWPGLPAEHSWFGSVPITLNATRKMNQLTLLIVVLLGSALFWIYRSKSTAFSASMCAALVSFCVLTFVDSPSISGQIGGREAVLQFAAWRTAIPPTSNVFVVSAPNSASFSWFVLGRSNYLSVDQSSGIIFSRQTALEIRRRTAVVSPLWGTNWRLLSQKSSTSISSYNMRSLARPLTADRLVTLCRDPQLNFVVAVENVGFDSIRHNQAGAWKDWNLYDCRRVNSTSRSL